jgi:hypothetical protein
MGEEKNTKHMENSYSFHSIVLVWPRSSCTKHGVLNIPRMTLKDLHVLESSRGEVDESKFRRKCEARANPLKTLDMHGPSTEPNRKTQERRNKTKLDLV